MKTEWKEVAHLYLGCDVVHVNSEKRGKLLGIKNRDSYGLFFLTNCKTNMGNWSFSENIKPILRPIHTMTQGEMIEWASMNGYDLTKEEKTIEEVHKSLTKGLKEKGLNYLKVNESEFELVPKFLLFALKHHFDLFSLIPSGQAIDRTTPPSLTNNKI